MVSQIRLCQMHMRTQVEYNTFRSDYLQEHWNKELLMYSQDLQTSEHPYHRYMYEQIHKIDPAKVKKLLELYL
jgi:hypothetical protein